MKYLHIWKGGWLSQSLNEERFLSTFPTFRPRDLAFFKGRSVYCPSRKTSYYLHIYTAYLTAVLEEKVFIRQSLDFAVYGKERIN